MRFAFLWLLPAVAAAAPPTLTLDDAIKMARTHHPAVMQQRAVLVAAQARLSQARSQFFPALTGSLAYQPQTANFAPTPGFQRVLQRPATTGIVDAGNYWAVCSLVAPDGTHDPRACGPSPLTTPIPFSGSLFNYWSAGVGIYWTLWDWGRTIYAVRSNISSVDAQKFNVDTSILQVVLDVKLAYYNALASDAAVRVAEEAVGTQKRHADQARAFYEVGTRTKIDVVSADSDVAAAELTLARARGALQASQAVLAAALGDENWREYQLVTPAEYEGATPGNLESAMNEALKARPEPRALAYAAKSSDELAKSVRGAFLPSLTVTAGPNWTGTDFTSLTTNFSATLALTFPLFGMNPMQVIGQMHEAQANRSLAEAQGVSARNNIRLETAQAQALLTSAHEAIVAAKKLVAAATERQQLAEGRYQAGVGSIIELSDAELNFVNARFQEVQASLDLASARARLDHALGR